MAKQSWKSGTLLSPVPPVMVSCGDMNNSNIITIAWTGIINTIPPMTYISLRPERYSYDIIDKSGEFIINLTTKSLIKAADWCGCRSGSKYDKFKEMNLTKEAATVVGCPAIAESPLNLECKVKDKIPLGSHVMFISTIEKINVDETLLDENNKLRLDKAHLAAFAHGEYFELGSKIGTFGFSVKKKKKHERKRT